MEKKEFATENLLEKKTRKKFPKIFANKAFLTCAALFILLLVLEFTTDFAEIVVGKIIDLTNPLRPKAGTFWEINKKDQLANDRLIEIAKNIPINEDDFVEINDLKQLSEILEQEQTVLLSPEQFRNIYHQIPPRFAFEIISPFDILKLSHSRKWSWTKITKAENSLSFFFMDGDKQLLMDTYPPLTVLYELPLANNLRSVTIDSMPMFQGRTISREQFFAAFDELSDQVKLQLINNPFQLIEWESNIRKVGISRYAIDNTVMLGFEVTQNIYTEVHTFDASELATNYLVARLNEIYTTSYLEYPEKK